MEDKNKYLQSYDINSMVGNIKETKMAIENELEDIKGLKDELSRLNEGTRTDAQNVDVRLSKMKAKINTLKAINEEQT